MMTVTMRNFNMLHPIVLMMTLLPNLLLGQIKKFELGIMIGNNGQLENALNDFYVPNYMTLRFPIKNTHVIPTIKYNASIIYNIKDYVSVRLTFGKTFRQDLQTQISSTGYWDFDIHQSIVNVSPAVCFSKQSDKFEISTGFEIPIIKVNDFVVNNNRYGTDSMKTKLESIYNVTTKGGFIWGFNNFIGLRYHFTDQISLSAEIKYGLLFSKLGGSYTVLSKTNADPNSPFSRYSEIEKKYKSTFFSPPEISFGVFLKFGNLD